MQFLYDTKDGPEAYIDGAGYIPAAPRRCPHKGCHMPVELKKHGYYKRYLILGVFVGYIRIRRYRCPVCGKTVSMLPLTGAVDSHFKADEKGRFFSD